MKTNLTARTVIIVVTILICVFGIIGIPKSGADLVKNFNDNIRLGLDLKGGSHLVLEIDSATLVADQIDALADRVRAALSDTGLADVTVIKTSSGVSIQDSDPARRAKIRSSWPIASSVNGIRSASCKSARGPASG